MKNAARACRYTIRLKGCLDPRRSEWLDGMSITCNECGETILNGAVIDQAALHGLLNKISDLGLPAIELQCLTP
jgi:hypothetical protein